MTDCIAFDSRHFRDVLGAYPTGVCVITALGDNGVKSGLVVGTFTSISLDPPLVGFFPDRNSNSWAAIAEVGRFCVNVLGDDQTDLCNRFSARAADKFADLAHGHSPSGMPLLDNAVAWIDCDITDTIELGDHWLVVGRVTAMARHDDRNPLLFYKGRFHNLEALGQTR